MGGAWVGGVVFIESKQRAISQSVEEPEVTSLVVIEGELSHYSLVRYNLHTCNNPLFNYN